MAGDPYAAYAKPEADPYAAYAGPTPSNLDSIISEAAQRHGIKPSDLRAVGDAESGLGKSSAYDPVTGRSRTAGNQGRGIFQLDPASGASQADLDRAATDPAFAADYAARMLAERFRAHPNDPISAFASYNGAGPAARSYGERVAMAAGYAPAHPRMQMTREVGGPAPEQTSRPMVPGGADPYAAYAAPPNKVAQAVQAVENGAGTGLGTFVDYASLLTADSPFFGALARDARDGKIKYDRKTGNISGPSIDAAAKLLGHPTPVNIHQAVEQYSLTSKQHGDLFAPLREPIAQAHAELKKTPIATDPGSAEGSGGMMLARALTSGAAVDSVLTMGAQSIGGAGSLGSEALTVLRAGARAVGKPLMEAAESALKRTQGGQGFLKRVAVTREGVDRFSGVRRAAAKTAKERKVDPKEHADKAEVVARKFVEAEKVAKHRAAQAAHSIADGATSEELREIERRSENFGPRSAQGPLNPPRPAAGLKGKLDDDELDVRATRLRGMYLMLDHDQNVADLLDKNRTFDPYTYTSRSNAYEREIKSPDGTFYHVAKSTGVGPKGAQPAAMRIVKGTASSSGGAKVFTSYDEAEHALAKDYNPADGFIDHFVERATSVAKEQALRDFKALGMAPEKEIFNHRFMASGVIAHAGQDGPRQFVGRGEAGVQKLRDTSKIAAKGEAFSVGLKTVNAQRAVRGEAPVTADEFTRMQDAVAKQGIDFRDAKRADQRARTMGALSGKAAKTAATTRDRAGQELLARVTQRVREVDIVTAKIEKMRSEVAKGDLKARAQTLGAMVDKRDAMIREIETMRRGIQGQAEKPLGKPGVVMPRGRVESSRLINSHDLPANRGTEPPVLKPAPTGQSQIYAPVVGRLQEVQKTVESLPPSALKRRLTSQLSAVGNRALRAPEKIGDAVDRRGDRLLKSVTTAMNSVARAGRDDTSKQILRQLEGVQRHLTERLTRESMTLYERTGRIAKPAQRLAKIVAGADVKAQKALTQAIARYDFAKASRLDVAIYKRAFREAQVGRASANVERSLRYSAEETFRRTGRVDGELAGTGSKTFDFATVDPALARFFETQGAAPHVARGIGAFVGGMTRLARIGVLTNPVQHAGWNLGTHFLASGGSPEFFATRLWSDPREWKTAASAAFKRDVSGAEWEQLATENGAVLHNAMTHGIFGGDFGVVLSGPKIVSRDGLAERGILGTADAAASKLWQMNQRIVFDSFEKRYSVELFRQFVEEGLSPAAAGIKVRKALGDYANISAHGIDAAFSKGLFFYPWLKTIVPFWAHAAVTRPQYLTVPGLGIRRWDQAMGDPDADTDSGKMTIDFGRNPDGSRRKSTFPGPQRIAYDLFEMLLPKGDIQEAGIKSFSEGGIKLLENRLRPYTTGLADQAIHTKLDAPQQPGGASKVLYNTDLGPGDQAVQAAETIGSKLPFAEVASGAASAVKDLTHGDVRRAESVLGGFQYDRLKKSDQKAAAKPQHRLNRALARAAKMKNPETKRRAMERAREQFKKAIKRQEDRMEARRSAKPDPYAAYAKTDPYAAYAGQR